MYIACDRVEDTRWCGKWECSFKGIASVASSNERLGGKLRLARVHHGATRRRGLGALAVRGRVWPLSVRRVVCLHSLAAQIAADFRAAWMLAVGGGSGWAPLPGPGCGDECGDLHVRGARGRTSPNQQQPEPSAKRSPEGPVLHPYGLTPTSLALASSTPRKSPRLTCMVHAWYSSLSHRRRALGPLLHIYIYIYIYIYIQLSQPSEACPWADPGACSSRTSAAASPSSAATSLGNDGASAAYTAPSAR